MRTAIGLAAVLAMLAFSTGCWDRKELNDLALVTAAAFDRGAGDSVRVTVQFFIPKTAVTGGGGGGGGGQEQQTATRYEEGENIADALARLQMKVPRKIFWGQCKVFIFSQELARSGIQNHFDLLIRSPQFREHAYMFVSEGQAAAVLDTYPPLERSSASVIRDLTQLDIGIKVTVGELSRQFKSDSHVQMIPMVRILPLGKGKRAIPYESGTAVLKNGRMTGTMSEGVTRGVMWVLNQIREYVVTFENEEGPSRGRVSLRPVKASTKVTPRMVNGSWQVDIFVRTQGDITQNETLENPINPEVLARLEKSFSDEIGERIKQSLREVQRNQKADVVSFAEAFHRKYPKQWEKAKDDWEKIFPEIKVNVRVAARINRPGLVNVPGGVPYDQVNKE
ncbi:Ger(x)C family spore germination protein [Cohnella lubricantis]|uniref:Ger(X)C family spore germination protein n=1 Tax=Cohnella lubricantis TaxID=2163172 RepID=A0A841TD71_9BACL|nr:Ger(x)C family spore germination protein [Cohnella lubricantis]MBB6677949.1 Ger(x)C family spore germination protein [Cohnella lubricantis]MBP2119983.1 spore germination protein KC [Cohnella lubricantis]